jgi:hypothetical protein
MSIEKHLSKKFLQITKLTAEQIEAIEDRISYLSDCDMDMNNGNYDTYKWVYGDTCDWEGYPTKEYMITDEALAELNFLENLLDIQEDLKYEETEKTFTGIFSTGDQELDKLLESIK